MDLEELRESIDRIDAEIVELLKKRFRIAGQIGEKKRSLELEVADAEREKEVLENYRRNAGDELDRGFVEELVELLLRYSREAQER